MIAARFSALHWHVPVHNDLIMTAKQKPAAGSLRFHRRESDRSLIVADPFKLERLAVKSLELRLVAGCEGTKPKAPGLDSAPQDRNVQCWDCRSLYHGNPEMLQQPKVSTRVSLGVL